MEIPIWACKTAQVPKPRIKQTNKLKKYLIKIVRLLQKSISAKCVVVPDPSGPWSITNTAMN